MSFLTLSQVKTHLRIDGSDSDSDLMQKIAAAELAAINHLQCNVYTDQAELDAAIAAVPVALSAAKAAYVIAEAEAAAIEDVDLSLIEQAHAMDVYMRAVYSANRTRNGIVINDLVIAAMLLTVGWLSEHREDDEKIPKAARSLLNNYRCYA